MMKTPARLKDVRRLMDMVDVNQLEESVAREARARLIIIGPVNSGKSTLFNQLKGQKLSDVSAVPGTTTDIQAEHFGPFVLLDTPGLGEVKGEGNTSRTLSALDQADVAILVLDAMAGIRQDDANLYADIRAMGIPVVVVLNKIDLIKKDLEAVIHNIERKLGIPVIPISAKKGTNIADRLIPALIDAHPRMAVTIGRSLPRYRKVATRRIIRESAGMAAFVGAEPVPGLDIPLLIVIQIRMILRLSMIYGETISARHARELLGAIAGGVAIRYAGQELVKLIPVAGWIVSGGVAMAGTATLGQVAVVFFENAQKLSPEELRKLYKSWRWKRRARRMVEESDFPQDE